MILSIGLIALLGLHSGTATGQISEDELQKRTELALLDSLIRYEYLKPRYISLKKSYDFLSKENDGRKIENGLLSFQSANDKAIFESRLKTEKQKTTNTKWVAVGLAILVMIAAAR